MKVSVCFRLFKNSFIFVVCPLLSLSRSLSISVPLPFPHLSARFLVSFCRVLALLHTPCSHVSKQAGTSTHTLPPLFFFPPFTIRLFLSVTHPFIKLPMKKKPCFNPC